MTGLTRTIAETDNTTSNQGGARLDNSSHSRSKQTLYLLRILGKIGGNSTSRVLFLVKPLDVVSENRVECLGSEFGIEGDTCSRVVECLEQDRNTGQDGNDEEPSTACQLWITAS